MKLLSLPTIIAAAGFSAVAAIPFGPDGRERSHAFYFEAQIAATSAGNARLYLDRGSGLTEEASVSAAILPQSGPVLLRLPLPDGTFPMFRFDPIDGAGTITVTTPRIVDHAGRIVRKLTAADFQPAHQIDVFRELADGFEVITTPGGSDPQLNITFEPALTLEGSSVSRGFPGYPARALIVFGLTLGIAFLAFRTPIGARALAWSREMPGRATACVALAAVVVSCYPVIFLGRSFVSPNFVDGTFLLYQRWPTLPGYEDATTENAQASDVGALPWHHHPLSIVEHRALFRDGELPLWNRYNCGGVTLLGQGQSMFGDPLHLLAVAANGRAWAWDLKYLVAKWLFAWGLGLVVLHLTRHVPSALLTALSSAFIGFFLYRVNHPAFFSMCYAPWILFAWVGIVQAADLRDSVRWLGLLILGSYCELTSGTVKEAYMLLLNLNLTGAILLAASTASTRVKLAKFGGAIVAGVLFAMLAAPVWVTFYDALHRAYTFYDAPMAFQIHPSLIIGLFDELFYRPIHNALRVFSPSANFLVLLGVLYTVATWRRAAPDRLKTVLGIATLVPVSLAFGVVPPEWIMRVPFLGNVVHIDNTFSCVAIVHLIALAGFGFKATADRLGTKEGRGDVLVVAGLLAVILVPYIALTQTVHRDIWGDGSVFPIQQPHHRMPVPAFVWLSLAAMLASALALGFVVRRRLSRGAWTPALAIVAIGSVAVMLWRFGQQARFGFDPYVFNPPTRVDFHAPSKAISFIENESPDPYRVVGFDANLMPGWSAVYDLETIAGPDSIVNPHFRELMLAAGVNRVWDWRVIVEGPTLARLRPFYDALNVRYFVDQPRQDPTIAASLRAGPRFDLDVYMSDTAWPRAFFTDRVAVYSDATEFAAFVRDGDGRPFAAAQTAETSAFAGLSPDVAGRTIVRATDYRLTANTTSFSIDAPAAGVIVLGEAWLEHDLHATVNGRPTNIIRVNHAFRGIRVDTPGTYRIKYSYWPRHLTVSLVASVAALLSICLIAFRLRRNHPSVAVAST